MSLSIHARRTLASSTVLAALFALTGCADANGDACDDLQATLKDVTARGLKLMTDPASAEKAYTDGAESIREIADRADGDVQTSARSVADALEELGHSTAQLGSGSPTSAGIPSPEELASAISSLEKACG